MAVLARRDAAGHWQDAWFCDDWIARTLAPTGIAWGRWPLRDIADGSAQAAQHACRDVWGALSALCAVRSAAWLVDDGLPPPAQALAATEIRLVAAGAGLLTVHDGPHTLSLLCDAGEWFVLPAGVPHVFEAGAAEPLRVLRLGAGAACAAPVATGHAGIAAPTFDAFVAQVMEWTGDVAA